MKEHLDTESSRRANFGEKVFFSTGLEYLQSIQEVVVRFSGESYKINLEIAI